MVDRTSPVIIVGGGAWGLSIALHLNAAGHSNITVYERGESIPSRYSAAWDLNKIVRAEYEDPFYTDLALEAIEEWKKPLWGPYFHQTGYVVAATGRAPQKAVDHLEHALSSVSSHPAFASDIRRLSGAKDFKKYTWQYSGPLTGFKGYYNRLAGYAHSADTLKGIWEHLARRGVKFVLGEEAGKVVELLYDDRSQCCGIKTGDGRTHTAGLTICAAGAWGASLVPDMAKFVVAKCWSVAHVQLSKAEVNHLRGIPTTNVRDLGFFFEPDPETGLFKLCPLGAGYTNPDKAGTSLPPADQLPPPQDFIPWEDEKKLRQLLRETFPWMADRPFVDQKLCWFADTSDSEYCIDFVPGTSKSLIVVTGDSGHGFKMMPTFGKFILNLLNEGEQKRQQWRWKTEDERTKDWGAAVSWRVGQPRELNDLIKDHAKLIQARL
ncbi:hypothetical protein KVT40_007639 [Elsinoe batatas]|uniref:FAD dependent oxidoreductase domain-containing protein n=1 Tax=Elsinoe batatas TaxID=2601811 RepID=A0A8K0PDG7_9PEZI|nr:hypothetical protein KVT40_007639 [Elsinoe batatas]